MLGAREMRKGVMATGSRKNPSKLISKSDTRESVDMVQGFFLDFSI